MSALSPPTTASRPTAKAAPPPATRHALIVDDDADAATMLAALVAGQNFSVATARNLSEARRQILLHPPDIVLLDLKLPDGSGMDLFADTQLTQRSEIVLVTGHASLESSIQALRLGAADYLVKPVHLKQLEGVLSRVTPPSALLAEVEGLTAEVAKQGHFGALWGRSLPMRRVYQQISRVAGTGVTVFITGESGTGKEVVAQTVHDLSRRRKRPFLAVNCGAISPNLIESEIFGHEKGSFTGADRQHQGFFERAHGGTLFLDEITEMPMELQVKLLRVLETGTYLRVGSTTTQEADVRVIAASNRPPQQAVEAGKLREDLLYRLNVFPIELPPLAQRAEDIPLLAEHFLQQVGEREGERKRFAPAAITKLVAYRWPGNVRELRNVVQRAYVMAESAVIDDDWLPSDPPGTVRAAAPPVAMPAVMPAEVPLDMPVLPGPLAEREPEAEAALLPPLAEGAAGLPAAVHATADAPAVVVPLGTSLADAERLLIMATLQHYRQHKERTAAALGISLKTLYNRLKEYAADSGDGS
ncbi:sigma-54-dependent Fis family transcriptional regulator [Aquincola sp. S2]|uniref:Sigma-54-dependent Fis family transcriptional regulator n=1 Tax=Pseudaquabacterium terrae TaxID=2732868 RepID=A0ABX2EHV5_9BURK|nr:sigma-54 dependent transcriptional regulator [Aquabacterium terrae]NRF68188.1 sigma-54-dependent Fis family transcriptional regulator [Aquabacterium terrae]